MPPAQPRFEEAGGHRLPLGGVNGYRGVRGKQGREKNMFQGVTPKKKHLTKLFKEPLHAAIALAQLQEDLELRMLQQPPPRRPATPAASTVPKKFEVGTYLGHLLKPPRPVIPTVACALLSTQQAAAAAVRGVPVAMADVVV